MRTLALLGVALLSGACSETSFSPVDPDDDDDSASAPDGPSPWDDLDLGQVPDVYFAVLWHDVTNVVALDESNDQYPCRPGPSLWTEVFSNPRLDIVDLRGRVVESVELPVELDPYGQVELHALGPDRFLVHASGLSIEKSYLWQVDVETTEVTELLRWSEHRNQAHMTLDGGAVRVQLPTAFSALHPTVIDDVLYVAIQQGGSADPPPLDQVRLVAVDLTDPTRIHRTWSAADLIPDVAEDRQPPPRLIIRHLRAADGDLLLQAQFEGPSWDGEDARSAWRSYRYVFYPDAERISWTLDLSSPDLDTQPSPVHRHTDDVRAALVSESAHEVSEPGLRLFRSRGGHVDITPSGHSCVLPRAVLDSAGPTVLYSLHEPTGPDDYGNELVFSHRGRDVARVKQLKDGLNKRRAHIQSLAVLEQP